MTDQPVTRLVGPLKIINRPHPRTKYEALCHKCNAAFFESSEKDAREKLLSHIDIAHINPIVWKVNARQIPGHG